MTEPTTPTEPAPTALADIERDAARWRKLQAMMQAAYGDDEMIENGAFLLGAEMVSGYRERMLVRVVLNYEDARGGPLDFGAALDAVPWPLPPAPDEER